MPRDPNISALIACGQKCLQATNGHHRRWAAKRCTDALVAAGTPHAIAARSAQAMVAVATRIADLAAAASVPAARVVQHIDDNTGVTRAQMERFLAQARAQVLAVCANQADRGNGSATAAPADSAATAAETPAAAPPTRCAD